MYSHVLDVNYFLSSFRLERKTVKRKRVLATLKVLGNVLVQLTEDISPEEADRLIPEEVCIVCYETISSVLGYSSKLVFLFRFFCKLLQHTWKCPI